MFTLALVFVTVSFRWESNQLLPWTVRWIGVAAVGLVVVGALNYRGRVSTGWSSLAERHSSISVGVLAVAAFGLALSIAYVIIQPFPHFPDGFSYYFQARNFALGRAYATAPPLPQFFEFDWVAIHEGRWFSIFPPGWPLILAAGVKLGIPAFVNPLLASLCIIVVYHIGATLFGRTHGLLCALFCCLSPFFLFMSAEFMSHTAALLFTSLSTLAYVKATSGRSPRFGLFAVSGLAAGIGFLVRPTDAFAIWVAQMAHGLSTTRARGMMVRAVMVSAALLSCCVGLYLVYNRVLVGTWFSSPLLLVSPRNRLGFGPDIGYDWETFSTPGHTPWRAFLNLNYNAAVMSQDLFGWPITSLFFVILLAAFGRWNSRHGLCGAIIASSICAYALYWYHGVAFGARFYFTLLPYLLVLTVEGIRQAPDIAARYVPRIARRLAVSRLVTAMATICFVFGWTVYMPKVSLISPYHDLKGVNSHFYDFQRTQQLHNALVFVRVSRPLDYGPAFISNDTPIGTGSVVYAVDRGDDENGLLAALFPGRSVHRYVPEPPENPATNWRKRLSRLGRLWVQRDVAR